MFGGNVGWVTAGATVCFLGALALFKEGLVKWIRKAVPYVKFVSGVLLCVSRNVHIYHWLSSGGGVALPG
jgi:cytochrome c-type biogenesis protein